MDIGWRAQPRHLVMLRQCAAFGFWLLAASAAATLGLDPELGSRL